MRDSWYRLLSLEHLVDRCYRVEPWLHVARFMVGMDGYGYCDGSGRYIFTRKVQTCFGLCIVGVVRPGSIATLPLPSPAAGAFYDRGSP